MDEVDLDAFIESFAKWAQASGDEIDLFTAGGLIHFGWSVLSQRTTLLAQRAKAMIATASQPEAELSEASVWDGMLGDAWVQRLDVKRAYTLNVLEGPVPLQEAVRRRDATRHVSVAELVDALEEARAEAERQLRMREEREARTAARERFKQLRAQRAAVQEDPQKDIVETRARLAEQGETTLRRLAPSQTPAAIVGTMLALLQMAKDQEVVLDQPDFPYGPVVVRPRQRANV